MRYRIAVLIGLLVLGGCGGSGGGVVPGGSGGGDAPNRLQQVTFKIDAPTQVQKALRGPKYLSPATQSIQVQITPQSGCMTCSGPKTLVQNLTVNSSGCTSSLASVTCSLTVSLNPGTYTATLTTYDQQASGNPPSSIPSNANILSQNQQVSFTVNAGQNNVVPLTLYGVPAQVQLVLAGSPSTGAASVVAVQGGSSPVYDLVTSGSANQTVQVLVEALDADNDIIVGVGAPTFTVTPVQSGGSSLVTVTGPTPSSPNVFTVTTGSGGLLPGQVVPLAIAVQSSGGVCSGTPLPAGCGATLSVAGPPVLAVGNQGSSTVSPSLTFYALPLTQNEQPIGTISLPTALSVNNGSNNATGQQPHGLAVDSSGNLYVSLNNTYACRLFNSSPCGSAVLWYANGAWNQSSPPSPTISQVSGSASYRGLAVYGDFVYVVEDLS